jgi:RsiW-degrading membrane proteinase PrsW (M82 family)
VLGCSVGGLIFVLELLGAALTSTPAAAWSVILAFVPVGLYLSIPYLIDRYDPEPWWTLAGVFLWGALFATGFSAVVNTIVMHRAGPVASAVVSAPIVEELTKGMAVFGIVLFVRREFDGVVDGIIYGTFAGIGFAAVENVGYYFRFREAMGQIFIVRGVLSPWLHPLFTSMTGLGFGLAREHGSSWAKVLFPAGGYCVAVVLHAIWNGTSTSSEVDLLVKVGVGICLALIFIAFIIRLVVRKKRTLREYLQDEVLLGTMSQYEVDLVCSPFSRIKARRRWGQAGRDFVKTAARLSLSKWHTARAMKGKMHTISADFIGPYRQELARLRQLMR